MATLLEEISEALRRCNRCGLCLAGCPIYKVTGLEWTVARGRLAMIKGALLDDQLTLEGLEEPLSNCLTCNGCVDHCPPAVPVNEVIVRAREELYRRRGRPWLQRFLLGKLLPRPSWLQAVAGLVRWGQVGGLEFIARKTGLIKLIGDAGRTEALLPLVPSRRGFEALSTAMETLERPRFRVAYFVGCATSNLSPGVAIATVRVLHRHRIEVVVPKFRCCGKPAYSYGDTPAALSLARKNLDIADTLNIDAIVTTCATCSSFLKDYPKMLAADPEYEEKAQDLSAKMRDFSEVLAEVGLALGMGFIEKRVTYHDPCHLGRFQKITGPPRSILKSIPGVEFVELAEADMCCGAAGSYGLGHYELSMKVLARKMEKVAKTGADLLVTACPACALQLSYGVKRHKLPVRVLETAELLEQAYETV